MLVLSLLYFVLFIFPNRAGSENLKMVAVFSPDEAVPLPYLFEMLAPAETLKQTLINFAFYDYYFYGYPHFAYSALVILPLNLLSSLHNTALVMLVLRQFVSVLPILAAILLLVYLQTGFHNYQAVLLFLLLATLPAVVQNNLWWHPDSLAILFMMLAIFFLQRDALRLGIDYYLAALMCGIAAGTKGIGFYFFLSVAVYLLFALVRTRPPWYRLALAAAGFLLVMAAAYLLSNPILVYASIRQRYFGVMHEQSRLLFGGYELAYPKGLLASRPALREYFGSWWFLLAALAACIWQVLRPQKRLLHLIILTWVLPITFLVFVLIHFKFQYWLPAALPLISSTGGLLPNYTEFGQAVKNPAWRLAPRFLLLGILLLQIGLNLHAGAHRLQQALTRQENSRSIRFYEEARKALSALPADAYFVYHDVRMYVPDTPGWQTESRFEMLDYDYINGMDFDILLLMHQRIADYLNDDAVAIDADRLARSQVFYRDARAGQIKGYHLVYTSDFGAIFIKEGLAENR